MLRRLKWAPWRKPNSRLWTFTIGSTTFDGDRLTRGRGSTMKLEDDCVKAVPSWRLDRLLSIEVNRNCFEVQPPRARKVCSANMCQDGLIARDFLFLAFIALAECAALSVFRLPVE